jgi:hypothetical protein
VIEMLFSLCLCMFMLSEPGKLLFLVEFIAHLTCSVVISMCVGSNLCVFLSMIL